VWAEPIVKVAARYGVSDVGLAKALRQMLIPLPPRGHWAKLRAGKESKQTPLPAPAPDTPTEARFHIPEAEALEARARGKQDAAAYAEAVHSQSLSTSAAPPQDLHALAKAAARRLHQKSGWKNQKGLRSAPGEVLNLDVTEAAIDRAVSVASLVIHSLTTLGAVVEINAETKQTLVHFRDAVLKFSITEHVARSNHVVTDDEQKAIDRYNRSAERGQWPHHEYPSMPQYDWHPSGILMLTVGSYPARSWKDTPRTILEHRLPEIISGIVVLAAEVCAKEADQKRSAREAAEAKERYRSVIERRQFEQQSFDTLEANATRWERATRIRAYVAAATAASENQGNMTEELREWAAWARAKADWVDPLVPVSDSILDAPEPKKPGHWWDH
jgi:hypothetical protein